MSRAAISLLAIVAFISTGPMIPVAAQQSPPAAQAAPATTQPAAATAQAPSAPAPAQPKIYETTRDKAYRFERGGWIYVHLEGSPHDIGFQHGYLLAPEIAGVFAAARLEMTHDTGRDWEFFRRAAREMLWPKIEPEYQAELQGIVDGLAAKKVKLDRDDIVALNAMEELPDYYVPWLNEKASAASSTVGRRLLANDGAAHEMMGHCSAFVATGSWTKDGQIVMAHNNWSSYVDGARWRIVFDIVPQSGQRILMDGIPGVIASDDDFGVNAAGIMITETTIGNFHGFDPNGAPEFVRARKAMQYAASIDDFVKIMLDANNGGYANDWLLGDRKTGEIARFELGLKHSKVWRTKDGYYSGANFPSDPDLIKDETTFDTANLAGSANARRVRWDQLLNETKGKIDTAMAQVFLADHYDTFTKKEGANRRTLCGHGDVTAETLPGSTAPPFDPWGAVQGKVMDSRMAEAMKFVARIGHPCGTPFDAAKFLELHPEFSWQAPVLRDMPAAPWTPFATADHASAP